jgi:NitT/TauT family transport system substrate-binding protein
MLSCFKRAYHLQGGKYIMKKSMKLLAMALAGTFVLSGCANNADKQTASAGTAASTTAALQTAAETTAKSSDEAESSQKTADPSTDASKNSDNTSVRVGSLKGPTSMGLAQLTDRAKKGETENDYTFTMAGKADELVGSVANGDLDIVLVPANVASILYTKTQGNVNVIDINTLGVLYVVASDDSISSMKDLKGKTLYMTGKGTTPEYVMNYLLSENGLTDGDVTLEFKSEAAEVASVLKEDPSAVGVLPQPFATAACIQNEALKPVLDLTEQWNLLNKENGSQLVTGVTIVRSDFLKEHEDAVKLFIEDHKASAAYTSEHPDEAAEMVAALGIVEKAPVAKKAMPACNIVCITGDEMKSALSGYLSVLEAADAKSVGGQLPADDFYYLP